MQTAGKQAASPRTECPAGAEQGWVWRRWVWRGPRRGESHQPGSQTTGNWIKRYFANAFRIQQESGFSGDGPGRGGPCPPRWEGSNCRQFGEGPVVSVPTLWEADLGARGLLLGGTHRGRHCLEFLQERWVQRVPSAVTESHSADAQKLLSRRTGGGVR